MCSACDWKTEIERAQRLISDAADLLSRAEDFASGVTERLEGMVEWMEANEHVTEKMIEAMDNIERGIERWNR